MRRFAFLFLIVPLAIVIIVLSVANRTAITLSLDPFGAPASALSLTGPFFVFLFAALALGVLIGGTAAWIGQGKWRHAARYERDNAARLRRELDQMRTRNVPESPALPPPPAGFV